MKLERILVDQDDVLADFQGNFLRIWRERYPKRQFVPIEERKHFMLEKDYASEYEPDINEILSSPGFFRSMPPIEGAIEAVKEIKNKYCEVFICTSPLRVYQNSIEKYEWVEQYLGPEWIEKIILTKDKTLVRGDILIDDKPIIKGIATPAWEHILYTQPYNKGLTDRRHLTWKNWKEVLGFK